MTRGTLCRIGLALACASAPVHADCDHIDDPLTVVELHLKIDPADWDFVLHDENFDDDGNQNTEKPALFHCGEDTPVPVLVRRKKLAALPSSENPVKVSLKIDFDDAVPDGEWHSHRKLSLENGAGGVLITEGLAWQLFVRSGAIAGGASWVSLDVNGKTVGVFTRVEQIDKSFLRRRIGEDEGFLYKQERQVTREGETDPYAAKLCYRPFGESCEPPADEARLGELCDVRQLVSAAAVNAFLSNGDSLFGLKNNYWWYSSERPRLYFPWDLDGAMSPRPISDPRRDPHDLTPGLGTFKVLWNDAGLRAQFDGELRRLIEDAFLPETIDRILDEIAAQVGPAVRADPNNALDGGFDAELRRIRAWVRTRHDYLDEMLPASTRRPVVINEVLASNKSVISDDSGEYADWVELHNAGPVPADLTGLYLSDDRSNPRKWPLPAITMEPNGFLLVWCDHDEEGDLLHTGFQLDADGDSIGLFEVAGGVERTLDFVSIDPQLPDVSLGRFPDGSPGFRKLECPTPAAGNRESCGSGATRFVRGDASRDGKLSITDAVQTLLGLFAGGPLDCPRAADANDDGKLEITDAVAVLQYLFLGGPAPRAPFPRCGLDTTADELECAEPVDCN